MSISLDKSTLVLGVGQSSKVTATTNPEGQPVRWSSNDKLIALPDSFGNIHAYKSGKTVITAVSGNRRVECEVEVFHVGIDCGDLESKMAKDQVFQIKLTPSNLNIELEVTNATEGILNIEVSEDNKVITVTCLDLGYGELNIKSTYKEVELNKTLNFEVVPHFLGLSNISNENLDQIKVHENSEKLAKAINGRPTMRIPKIPYSHLPTLYYVKVNKNPLVFEYEVHALNEDLVKFTLIRNSEPTVEPPTEIP